MSSNETVTPAAHRVLHNAVVRRSTLSKLSRPEIMLSRYLSPEFNADARRLIPRWITKVECDSRLAARAPGPSADPDSMRRYYQNNRPPTIEDQNVFAISVNPEVLTYTLAQILKVYPNAETFYADGPIADGAPVGGATIDCISDRLWVIRSDMRDSAARTALIDRLTSGLFSDEALSHCPPIPRGSVLSLRNMHRMARLKKGTDMGDSRYYRFTTLSPVYGPRDPLGEDSASVFNISSFARLTQEHASRLQKPAHPIKTIEYAPRTDDRLTLYRRFAGQRFPTSCEGGTTVIISSPDGAPDFFDLIADDFFPGVLKDMKHIIVDAAIKSAPRDILNPSQDYSSPHLESVTFRLQQWPDQTASDCVSDVTILTHAETLDEHLVGPKHLAESLYGSTARVVFAALPGCEHLRDICDAANTAISIDRQKRGLDGALCS